MSKLIEAQDVQVGDEIEFPTADGKTHRFVVGQLPRTEIHILPEDAAPKGENLFTLRPRDRVVNHGNVLQVRKARAQAVGRLTAERLGDNLLPLTPTLDEREAELS